MAYTNNRYPQNSYGKNRNDSYAYAPQIEAKSLPKDYVDHAEDIMREHYKQITTSKLRNILSLFMDIYNTEILRSDAKLTDENAVNIQMARIRIAYECGRDLNTKVFVEKAELLPYLKGVGDSREKAIQYIRYLEALVAYHRFFGGREN